MIKKISFIKILFLIISTTASLFLPGCFTTDKYHNEKHLDTIKNDLDAAHSDTDWVLGLDEPSSLVEER
ncbi:MAG: hypothetical protein HS132_17060 [Planctomycetia bacterium]|nr:hypothetical protein [Planctomycetia bacterium]